MEDSELAIVESIYDALDRADPETALTLARSALGDGPEDPVLHFLCGVALLDLDAPGDAELELARAVEMDPDDGEFRANLALARFRGCRFDLAADAVRAALEREDIPPDVHVVDALLHERRGDFSGADRLFERASTMDAERFPLAERLPRAEFEAHLALASERLPDDFRRRLDEVAVIVEDVPPESVLTAEEPPLDPELLGLFVGIALDQRTYFSPGGELPPTIHLFQRNLERFAVRKEALVAEIAVTLYHELGHYLGMDEDDLEEVDFA